jgi:acyl-CoA synthetase (AMP-forming)/AMP-acid ligase II
MADVDAATTVSELLAGVTEMYGEREFIVSDAGRLTYSQVSERSAVLAGRLLAAGVGKGTRVGVLFPSDANFVVTWLAVVRIGGVAVPMNTLATATELRDMIRFADLQHILAVPGYLRHDYVTKFQEALPELLTSASTLELVDAPFLRWVWFDTDRPPAWAGSIATQPEAIPLRVQAAERTVTAADPISIVFTSGSTGAPKGVVHTHGTLLRESAKMLAAWEYEPSDCIYTTMPFFWVGGLSWVLLTTMRAGATVVTSTDITPSFILDLLEREQITFAQFWPHTARAIAADPTFSARKLIVRGGSLYEAWIGDDDHELLANGLGMTETAGPHTVGQFRLVSADLKGSFGRPLDGMEHRIVDVDSQLPVPPGQPGELLVRGDTVMVALHRREPHTVFDADGWYHTGDYCTMRDGHLFFHGRVDDQIKVSGVNVSPAEVERVLMSVVGVSQAHVVAVPDVERGAIVAAAVVLDAAAGTDADADADITPSDVALIAAEQLASYKVPRIVAFVDVDDVPLKSSGKVDRLALAELLESHPRLR